MLFINLLGVKFVCVVALLNFRIVLLQGDLLTGHSSRLSSNIELSSLTKNNSSNSSSLLSRTPGIIYSDHKSIFSKYNITDSIPTLFKHSFPLGLEVDENDEIEEFRYSSTSRALNCYRKLPLYTLIMALQWKYLGFLSLGYRMGACEVNHTSHDGSFYGDLLYLMDLVSNKRNEMKKKLINKKKECLLLEANIMSLKLRFKNEHEFKVIGESHPNTRRRYLSKETSLSMKGCLLKESNFRRTVAQYEILSMKKTIEYEKYCTKDQENENIDCDLLKYERLGLQEELDLLSKRHFEDIKTCKLVLQN